MQSWRRQEIETPGYNLSPFSLARLTSLSCDLLLLLTPLINSFKYIVYYVFKVHKGSVDMGLKNTM